MTFDLGDVTFELDVVQILMVLYFTWVAQFCMQKFLTGLAGLVYLLYTFQYINVLLHTFVLWWFTEREKEEQEEEMEGREQQIRTLTHDLVGKHDKVRELLDIGELHDNQDKTADKNIDTMKIMLFIE